MYWRKSIGGYSNPGTGEISGRVFGLAVLVWDNTVRTFLLQMEGLLLLSA